MTIVSLSSPTLHAWNSPIIGGGGPKRTPALAARFASEFNTPFVNREFFTAQCNRVRAACEAIDCDPSTMTFSAALVVCCGADDAEVERRAAAIGRDAGELRENGAATTPDEVAATICCWAEMASRPLVLASGTVILS